MGASIDCGDRHLDRSEACEKRRNGDWGCGLIERERNSVGIDSANIDTGGTRRSDESVGSGRHSHGERVEECLVQKFDPKFTQAGSDNRCQTIDASGNALESVWAMPGRIESRHHGKQYLRRADIRRCLLATDVLLASLQRKSVRGSTGGIDGNADQATRQNATVFVTSGEETCTWSTKTKGNPESLR
ncbi:unannotated protein [freshwater metagenome]|uniref:Unannotated protein n=1 Tax=freshwater metagenome TaxID=449393 RepID=A0A6J6ARD7_9ZZZZ